MGVNGICSSDDVDENAARRSTREEIITSINSLLLALLVGNALHTYYIVPLGHGSPQQSTLHRVHWPLQTVRALLLSSRRETNYRGYVNKVNDQTGCVLTSASLSSADFASRCAFEGGGADN